MSDEPFQPAEQPNADEGFTRADRFASVLVIALTVVAILAGLALRQRSLNQTWQYTSREAGIEAEYPTGWLTDEQGNYVVRIRDPKSRPFKTQYIISVMPYGSQSSVRNVLDGLTIQRANDLSAYRVLNIETVSVGGIERTEMDFAFVDADPNPFIQRLPVVVQARDIVIIDGDRAIIVTFMSEQARFNDNLQGFERFLDTLRY